MLPITRNLSAIAFVACMPVTAGLAAETWLVCKAMSRNLQTAREIMPTVGINLYKIDFEQGTLRKADAAENEPAIFDVKITEAAITFKQASRLRSEAFVETFSFTISRIDGRYVRMPLHSLPDGRRIHGEELQALAAREKLAGWLFGGINEQIESGECSKDERKF